MVTPCAQVEAQHLISIAGQMRAENDARIAASQRQKELLTTDFAEVYREDHEAGVKEMRRAWAKPDIDRGQRVIEQMALWNEIPLVGKIITSRLADELDEISDRLEVING